MSQPPILLGTLSDRPAPKVCSLRSQHILNAVVILSGLSLRNKGHGPEGSEQNDFMSQLVILTHFA